MPSGSAPMRTRTSAVRPTVRAGGSMPPAGTTTPSRACARMRSTIAWAASSLPPWQYSGGGLSPPGAACAAGTTAPASAAAATSDAAQGRLREARRRARTRGIAGSWRATAPFGNWTKG